VFYLKQWTGVDGRLCEYSCPYKEVKARRRFPSETGFECGLYTLKSHPEPVAEIVERKLMRATDDFAARALHLLRSSNIQGLNHEMRCGWARFIISLMRRNPEAVQQLGEKLLNSMIEIDPDLALPGDPDNDEQARARLAHVERQRAILLQTVINSERLGTRLINMRWGVIAFSDVRYPLLTSDRLFVMTNGIGHAHSHIAIPISPTQCFVAAATVDEENKLRSISAENFMFQMNDRMAAQARKFVWGLDDKQLRFVANRFGRRERGYPFDDK
jgi:hypothetical protein